MGYPAGCGKLIYKLRIFMDPPYLSSPENNYNASTPSSRKDHGISLDIWSIHISSPRLRVQYPADRDSWDGFLISMDFSQAKGYAKLPHEHRCPRESSHIIRCSACATQSQWTPERGLGRLRFMPCIPLETLVAFDGSIPRFHDSTYWGYIIQH